MSASDMRVHGKKDSRISLRSSGLRLLYLVCFIRSGSATPVANSGRRIIVWCRWYPTVRAGDLTIGPSERRFQPVISPEQLAIGGDKTWRAENAEPLRFFGLAAQLRLDHIGLGVREHRFGIDADIVQQQGDHRPVADLTALRKLCAINRACKILAPIMLHPDSGDARRQ